ncbi:flagellar biosynthetic protein FliO [Gryllotalpicola sp.]|uniref:FliO/MopB family protein n=1 Tax=Gryllotalpicola sp. TaxID=1932787 RepID=UPI00261C9FB0|nr:flagellar biosynthetic protein FliO [Gryllotalpicola sp.]
MDVTVLLRVVVSLGVVFGAIWFISRRVRKRSVKNPRKTAAVQVLGRASVAGKASVVVVEALGRHLVLGVTEHGVTVLHDTEAPVEPPAPQFSAALHEAQKAAPLEALRGAVGLSYGATRTDSASRHGASPESQPEHMVAPNTPPSPKARPATFPKVGKPTWHPAERVSFRSALLSEVKDLINK